MSLATLANILYFSDTLLLTDTLIIETLGKGIQSLIEVLRTSQQKPQKLYAAAAIANASFHPRLAALLNHHGGTACYHIILILQIIVCVD